MCSSEQALGHYRVRDYSDGNDWGGEGRSSASLRFEPRGIVCLASKSAKQNARIVAEKKRSRENEAYQEKTRSQGKRTGTGKLARWRQKRHRASGKLGKRFYKGDELKFKLKQTSGGKKRNGRDRDRVQEIPSAKEK